MVVGARNRLDPNNKVLVEQIYDVAEKDCPAAAN